MTCELNHTLYYQKLVEDGVIDLQEVQDLEVVGGNFIGLKIIEIYKR